MKWTRAIYIYMRLMTQHIKAILEYQSDFWIAMCAAMMTQGLGIIFIGVVFSKIPHVVGWGFWEIAFLYSMVFISEGVSSFLFNGIWNIGGLVNRGDMDRLIIRPLPVVLQVGATAFGMNGLGNMLFGSIFLTLSVINADLNWSWWQVLLLIIFALSGVTIRISVNLVTNSVSFWSQGPRNSLPMMVHTAADFVKFPLTIFPLTVQLLVSIIVPYAFISYYPAAFLFGKGDGALLGLLAPIVALLCISLAVAMFNRGLKKYESAGN